MIVANALPVVNEDNILSTTEKRRLVLSPTCGML